MSVIAKDYVVLDVETNGTSSIKDDLLSISIYQPDTGKIYNRFLPLELNRNVVTTQYNGISEEDLRDKKPLTQQEVDNIIEEYELSSRIILTYGKLDQDFIKNYFKRKKINGYERLKFFNFKMNIISSKFTGGNLTKDNLCELFGIENVRKVHSGVNDCILEWKLFEKLDNKHLFITEDNVYFLNDNYIVPASYLSFPNYKYYLKDIPYITGRLERIKTFSIYDERIEKLPTNFNGGIIENVINAILKVEVIDSYDFLCKNKANLEYIGKLPSAYEPIEMQFNNDATVTAINPNHREIANEVNEIVEIYTKELVELVVYIRENIFKNEKICSQELVLHYDKNILALCDLSSPSTVLEIKTYSIGNDESVFQQLYYESNGRQCYLMQIDWSPLNLDDGRHIDIKLDKVTFEFGEEVKLRKQQEDLEKRKETFANKLNNSNVEIVEYKNSSSPVTLKCNLCGKTYTKSYSAILKNSACPYCTTQKDNCDYKDVYKVKFTKEQQALIREARYCDKVYARSYGNISVLSYTGSREPMLAHCNVCGNEWIIRADHLLSKTYCPACHKKIKNK